MQLPVIRVVTAAAPVVQHGWLYDWQALLAGLLALVPAVVIFFQLRAQREQNGLLRRQIERERERDRGELLASLRSWRVVLPSTLSEILDYSRMVGKELNRLWPAEHRLYPPENDEERALRRHQRHRFQRGIPTFPTRLVEPLQKIAQYTDDPMINQRIASIFREAQTLDAALRELAVGAEFSLFNLMEYIEQAMALYARAASLLDFARGASETIDLQPLWQGVSAALFLCDLDSDEMREFIDRQDKQHPPGKGDQLGLRQP